MESSPVHEALKSILWLEGVWRTQTPGEGKYPSIKPFGYHEQISFTSVGQPILNYESKSWHPESKKFLHLEVGFLKIIPGTNKLNLLSAHNFGVTTIEEGEVNDNVISLSSISIERSMSSLKSPKVLKTKREMRLIDEDRLQLIFHMATENNNELTEHLRTIYHKQKGIS